MNRPVDYPKPKFEVRSEAIAAIERFLREGGQVQVAKPSRRKI